MSEKPSGIALHALIHHLACISLSPALYCYWCHLCYNCYHCTSYNHVNKSHIYIPANKPTMLGTLWYAVINAWYEWSCDSIYLMLGFIVTITVIYVMVLLPSFGELATHTVDTSRCGVTCQQACQWLYHLVCVHCLAMAQLVFVKTSYCYTVQSRTNTC